MALCKKLGGRAWKAGATPLVAKYFKDQEAYMVELSETKATDQDLDLLEKLPITALYANSTSISDKGLATIVRHDKLSDLQLSWTKISDGGGTAIGNL